MTAARASFLFYVFHVGNRYLHSSWGASLNHVDRFLDFFDPPPPNVDQFTIITWTIFQNFQPPLPPSGPHGLSMTPLILTEL